MSALQELLTDDGLPTVAEMRAATAADLARLSAADDRVRRITDAAASHAETLGLFRKRPDLIHLAFNRYAGVLTEASVERDASNFETGSIWGRAFEIYHQAETLDERSAAVYRDIGAHVRQAPAPFIGHVFDEQLATVNLESESFDRVGAWRIEHPEMIADLRALFVRLWQWSEPLLDRSPDDDVLVLLRLLAEGRDNEQAAAELGVEELAYRRQVRHLMAVLGTQSAFAAGVSARRRGLLALAEAVA